MFNNKFNSSKKDPLVEAVQNAMQDGDLRRQAIAYVNEQFGVFSRNAVVNEHKAAYDAALEEAYRSIKEGKPLTPAQDRELDVHDDDKIDAKDFAKLRAMRKGKRMEEKKDCYEEGVKGSVEIDYSAPDRAAVTSGGKPATPAQTTSAPQDAPMPPKRPANLQELKKPTAKTAIKALDRAERSDDWYDSDYKRTNRLFAWKQKHLPGKSARNQKDTGKAELDDYDRKTVKKSGVLTKRSQTDTSSAIKSRLGKHTAPHLPEEYFYEAIARKKDIAKGGVTAPIEYADKMGFANPGAISKLDEAWNKLKEARKCMEEESDTFDFTHLDEAYANYIAEAINEYGLQEEHPIVTAENLYMFNEAYIAAVLGEAAKHEKEKAEDHEEKAKELDEARMRAEKECNEEKEEKEEHDEDTKKRKVLAKTLKHIARKKAMAEELQIDEVSAFGQAFRAAGGKNFSFGGKTYSGARADGKASTPAASTPGTQGVATGKSFSAIDKAQAAKAKSGPADNPGLRGASPAMPKTPGTVARDTGITGKPGGETGVTSGSTVSLDRQGNAGASPSAPAAPAPKPTPAPTTATSGSTPAGAKPTTSSGLVGPDAGKMATPSAPTPTTSQPGAPKDDASASVKKLMSMNESVQVGDNKYRIV